MVVAGLTGSIGMGKSTIAARFRDNGVAVFDADAEVHRLYAAEAVPLIESAFPGTTANSIVDRAALSRALLDNLQNLKRLEGIVHPLVQEGERIFLRTEEKAGSDLVVLEIPLLLETGRAHLVDALVVARATPDQQRERVMSRSGMTAAKFEALVARQMPDDEKVRRAHFVVDTSGSITATQAMVDAMIPLLRARPARAYRDHWAD